MQEEIKTQPIVPKKRKTKWWKTLLNVLLWLFVALSVAITVLVFASQSADGIPNVLGKMFITIQSDSMKDTFNKGDLIIVDKLTPDEQGKLNVDDIITFEYDLDGNGEVELNSHRIEKVINSGGAICYVTKGDNNEIADTYTVHNGLVKGKYSGVRLPFFGSALDFLRSPIGFGLIIVLPLIVFFFFELYNFISLVKKPKRIVTADDEEEIKRHAVEEFIKSQNENDNSEDK